MTANAMQAEYMIIGRWRIWLQQQQAHHCHLQLHHRM